MRDWFVKLVFFWNFLISRASESSFLSGLALASLKPVVEDEEEARLF